MITNPKNDRVKFISKLQQKARFRKEQGLFVCEGARLVEEIPTDRIDSVYAESVFLKNASNRELINRFKSENIRIEEVSQDVIKKMSDVEKPQGILAVVKNKAFDISGLYKKTAQNSATPGTDILCNMSEEGSEKVKNSPPLIVVLSSLQDPGNLGTIVRTAEAAGVSGIIASVDTVDLYSPKVIRATMGGIFRVPYVVVEDLKSEIIKLNDNGIKTLATVISEDSVDYDTIDMKEGVAIIIGNEGNGIPSEISDAATSRVHIPMQGNCESLNASIAAGVVMFEAARQRRQ